MSPPDRKSSDDKTSKSGPEHRTDKPRRAGAAKPTPEGIPAPLLRPIDKAQEHAEFEADDEPDYSDEKLATPSPIRAVPLSTAEPDPPSEPTTSEVEVSGPIPRAEPPSPKKLSGDLYIRLEGRIYGPFRPDRLEVLLQSGTLTGLESASADLNRWTPLAYHPRIVRGRVRDLDRVHQVLTELSALPARKASGGADPQLGAPRAAILRRPPVRKRRRKQTTETTSPGLKHATPRSSEDADVSEN